MEISMFKQCNGAGDVEYAYDSNQSISVVDILSVVEVLMSLEIGGKIYDVGDTANRVSGTELKWEAASESMVRDKWSFWPFPAGGCVATIAIWSVDLVPYLLLFT